MNKTETKPAATPPTPAKGTEAPRSPTATPARELPPLPPPDTFTWEGKAAAYLEARGWRRVGTNSRGHGVWADPNGVTNPQPELKAAGLLPVSGGGQEVLMQWHGPTVPWNYTTEDAVALQRERERNQESVAQQIARKQQELAQLMELATATGK